MRRRNSRHPRDRRHKGRKIFLELVRPDVRDPELERLRILDQPRSVKLCRCADLQGATEEAVQALKLLLRFVELSEHALWVRPPLLLLLTISADEAVGAAEFTFQVPENRAKLLARQDLVLASGVVDRFRNRLQFFKDERDRLVRWKALESWRKEEMLLKNQF